MWSRDGDEVATAFAARPWEAVPEADLARALAVPSMLSAEEARLYHWTGREARGLGATVDLGAFAGGSAARLLSGLEQSGHLYRLHAYDRFTAAPKAQRHILAGHLEPTDAEADILPLAESFLAPWALHRGDIREMAWDGGPIEILAYDAGKSAETADRIAETFLPALIPGRSIVLHQDFLQPSQPWLAAQAVLLAGHLRPLARVDRDCMAFLWTAPLRPEDAGQARTRDIGDDALIRLVRRAGEALAPFAERASFDRMIRRIRAAPGGRTAWDLRGRSGG